MRKTFEHVVDDLLSGRGPGALTLDSPHDKTFMPRRLSRVLERASYRDLFVVSIVFIGLAATLLVNAPPGNGLVSTSERGDPILEAVYFSIVTLTTVGYGDVTPQGYARAISCLIALYGVVALAFLVGKVASERSQSTLFLLLSSDRERRIKAFANEIREARAALTDRVAKRDVQAVRETTGQLSSLLEAVSNYVVFHAHHTDLAESGNQPAIAKLIAELAGCTAVGSQILDASLADAVIVKRSWALATKVEGTICILIGARLRPRVDFTSRVIRFLGGYEDSDLRPLSGSERLVLNKVQRELGAFRKRFVSRPNAVLVEEVLRMSPSTVLSQWPKGHHKAIAASLMISTNVTQKCIDALLASGRLTVR